MTRIHNTNARSTPMTTIVLFLAVLAATVPGYARAECHELMRADDSCSSTLDCAADMYCLAGVCGFPAPGNTCSKNADCGENQPLVCEGGVCVDKFAPGDECSVNADCGIGVCTNGVCAGLGELDACDPLAHIRECEAGMYCDPTTSTCRTAVKLGESCEAVMDAFIAGEASAPAAFLAVCEGVTTCNAGVCKGVLRGQPGDACGPGITGFCNNNNNGLLCTVAPGESLGTCEFPVREDCEGPDETCTCLCTDENNEPAFCNGDIRQHNCAPEQTSVALCAATTGCALNGRLFDTLNARMMYIPAASCLARDCGEEVRAWACCRGGAFTVGSGYDCSLGDDDDDDDETSAAAVPALATGALAAVLVALAVV